MFINSKYIELIAAIIAIFVVGYINADNMNI